MLDPHLRLRHLRCFLETARRESLSAAAEALHVSQPAASKTIRELEEMLGVALFDRVGRRLELTRAGQLFQQHAGAALNDLIRAQDLVRKAPARKQRLAVGVLPTVATEVFPRTALLFQRAFPQCLLRVSTGPNWLLLSQLREGALDMVIGRMPAPDRMEGLSFQQLYTEQVVMVVRPGHPLCAGPVGAAALARFPLMLPPGGAVISPVVKAYLTSIGLQNLEPAFENVSLAFGRKVVALSDTVWFISRGVVAEELAAGQLVALDTETEVFAGPVGISLRGALSPTAEQRGLIDCLIETTAQTNRVPS